MLDLLRRVRSERYGGALMFLLGIAAVTRGVAYQVGTISRMGPGMFPAVVGGLLALTGIAIFFIRDETPDVHHVNETGRVEWRAWLLICLSLVAFIVVGRYGGLAPATFALVFISALADRDNTVVHALLLALAMVAICVVVFWWLLQVQFPLFRWA